MSKVTLKDNFVSQEQEEQHPVYSPTGDLVLTTKYGSKKVSPKENGLLF